MFNCIEKTAEIIPLCINSLLIRDSDLHTRSTKYANCNLVCPRFKCKNDVTTCQ